MSKAEQLFQTYKQRLLAWANQHSFVIDEQTMVLSVFKRREDLHPFEEHLLNLENGERFILNHAHGIFMAHYSTGKRMATLTYENDAYTYSEHSVGSDGLWKYEKPVPVSEEDFERSFTIMQQFFLSPL